MRQRPSGWPGMYSRRAKGPLAGQRSDSRRGEVPLASRRAIRSARKVLGRAQERETRLAEVAGGVRIRNKRRTSDSRSTNLCRYQRLPGAYADADTLSSQEQFWSVQEKARETLQETRRARKRQRQHRHLPSLGVQDRCSATRQQAHPARLQESRLAARGQPAVDNGLPGVVNSLQRRPRRQPPRSPLQPAPRVQSMSRVQPKPRLPPAHPLAQACR